MKTGKYLKAILGALLILVTLQGVSAQQTCPIKTIFACDDSGQDKDTFSPGETVYLCGCVEDSDGDVYVTNNIQWSGGEAISGIYKIKNVDGTSLLSPIEIGVVSNGDYTCSPNGDSCIPYSGEYDVVFDSDQDGVYDSTGDYVDYVVCHGFQTIPEFTTIAIPMAIALLAGLFFFRRQ